MTYYYICINGKTFQVDGQEAAYTAFRKACEFGEVFGARVSLIDPESYEVLAENSERG